MRNWIEIDGRRSTEFGLSMARLPLWTVAAETVENITLPGVPVEMDQRTGQYQDFDLTLTGYLTQRPCNLPKLQAWIHSGKRLIMSTQPQIYGIIRKVGQITPIRVGTRAQEIQIPFTFQPFKYTRENISLKRELDTSPGYIHNWGNIYSEPVYELTISQDYGAVFFTVNGVQISLLAAALTDAEKIIIDIPRRKIYRVESNGDLTIVQRYTTGSFWKQVLAPGSNTIAWSNGISKVEVTVNERWL